MRDQVRARCGQRVIDVPCADLDIPSHAAPFPLARRAALRSSSDDNPTVTSKRNTKRTGAETRRRRFRNRLLRAPRWFNARMKGAKRRASLRDRAWPQRFDHRHYDGAKPRSLVFDRLMDPRFTDG